MAKITIAGDAVVITSSIKFEDLKTIAKYRPEALTLKGGEDGKEPIFGILVGKGAGEISKYGALFSSESHDDEKFATITMTTTGYVGGEEDIKEFVADNIGSAIINLNNLEDTLETVLEDIVAEKATVMSNISIA